MNDGVSAMAVLVVRVATRVPRLAFLSCVRFHGSAFMLIMMCVVAGMLRRRRTLFVQAIRCHSSGPPLQRQKQHEKGDHKITHGADCS